MNLISNYILAIPPDNPVNDSTELLVFVMLAITLMIFGLTSKYKIMCLFAVGVMLKLIVDMQHHYVIVVVLIGMILFNLWYAFLGSRDI